MARLIVKSPYIKCGGKQNASGYLQYIATRERVEIVPDDRPPTRKQKQLIQKLVKDFPDTKELLEYDDYKAAPTKANASSFITLALEQNWNRVQSSEGYAKYIATRPRAERLGSHGLFGDADHVSLDAAMNELEHYTGNVWAHIISLKREDAARLGYDNAAAWRTLLRAHRNDIAAAMNIKPEDFRWYAAFHDEGNHPHVHMIAWSATPGQAYLDRDGIRQIKSTLTNQIFQQELLHLSEEKSVSRVELVHQTRQAMLELAQRMRDGLCIRKVFLPKTVALALAEEKDRQREIKKMLAGSYQDFDLVVAHEDGRPYEERQVTFLLRKLTDATGLPPVVFHSLRHCSASLKLQIGGGNIKAVQGDTGHAQSRMVTDLYAHTNNEERRRLAEKVETNFFQKRADTPQEKPLDNTAEQAYRLLQENPDIAKLIIATLQKQA